MKIEEEWMEVPEKFIHEERGIDMNESYIALGPLSLQEVQGLRVRAERAGGRTFWEVRECDLDDYTVLEVVSESDGGRKLLWLTALVKPSGYELYFDAETSVEDLVEWLQEAKPEIGTKAVVGVCKRGHPQVDGVTKTWKRCRPCQNEYARARMQGIEPDWSRADQAAKEMLAGTWISGARNKDRVRPAKESAYEWSEE